MPRYIKDVIAIVVVMTFVFLAGLGVMHGLWAAFDCDMRKWNAADYGRTYSDARCIQDRAREGMWPAVWHGFAVPNPAVPLRHPSERTD